MNDFEQIQLAGKSYEIPKNKKDLKEIISLLELKDLAQSINRIAFFWGIIYLLLFFTSKNAVMLVLGLYFTIFAFASKGKYSTKYFLSQAIIIFLIAIFNIVDIFIIHNSFSATEKTYWTIFVIYQLYYAIKMFRLYLKNKDKSVEEIKSENYLATKKLIRAITKSKLKNENNIVEIRYGLLGSKIIRFLKTKNYIISVNIINRKVAVHSSSDFDLIKIKKVLLEKKYRVVIKASGKKFKGVMTMKEFEKHMAWSGLTSN